MGQKLGSIFGLILAPFWLHFGRQNCSEIVLKNYPKFFVLRWPKIGPRLAQGWPKVAQGAILSRFWKILGPKMDPRRPSWVILGRSWVALGRPWATLGQPGRRTRKMKKGNGAFFRHLPHDMHEKVPKRPLSGFEY